MITKQQLRTLLNVENLCGEVASMLDELRDDSDANTNLLFIVDDVYDDVYGAMCKLTSHRMCKLASHRIEAEERSRVQVALHSFGV
jgi:hypothetical protein